MTFSGKSIPQNSPYWALVDQFEDIVKAIDETIKNGQYVVGSEVSAFEKEYATFCQVKYCVGVASGTDALELLLRAHSIGPGCEVITVGNAGVPTIVSILRTGAKPVIVDVGDNLLIDPERVQEAVNLMTRAIVPVHLFGNVCDIYTLRTIAYSNDLAIIEDCAQAHGAMYNESSPVGENAGAWSFYPTKNLGALGDAGAITCSSQRVADQVRSMRQYGWDQGRISHRFGTNSRMDEIQAAVLRIKLRVLDVQNARRTNIAQRYAKACEEVKLPYVLPTGSKPVYHQFVIIVDDREEFIAEMQRHGVFTGIHYELPAYEHPYFRGRVLVRSFTKTDFYCARVVSLPMYAQLSVDDVERVCDAIKHSRCSTMPRLA